MNLSWDDIFDDSEEYEKKLSEHIKKIEAINVKNRKCASCSHCKIERTYEMGYETSRAYCELKDDYTMYGLETCLFYELDEKYKTKEEV